MDHIVRQRTIQFLLRLRKDTRLPRLTSDYTALGWICGSFFMCVFVTAVVMSFVQGYLLNRATIVKVSIYLLDALDSPISAIDDRVSVRILTVDHDVYRMTMKGHNVTFELMPAKSEKP